jgi:hypothetical protein
MLPSLQSLDKRIFKVVTMPKYVSEKLTSWTSKGYMDFEHIEGFRERYNRIPLEKDKNLATFLFFTGARPGELIALKREDVTFKDHKIIFRLMTLKRKKKSRYIEVGEGLFKREVEDTGKIDQRVRFIEWNIKKYPELRAFWEWVKMLPDDFYVFSWLRLPGSGGANPRSYIKHHIGDAAYFFRHNLFSLMSMKGASREMIKETKGAKSIGSVDPYVHLSKESLESRSRIMSAAIA